MPINPVIHFSMAHCFFRIVSDPLGGSRWPWRKEQFARETKGTWQQRRHFLHLPSHSSDQLEASHNKGRRNWMNGLGEVGCVYVCSARVGLLWFQSSFRMVSAVRDERNNLQTKKTWTQHARKCQGNKRNMTRDGDISYTYLRTLWKDMKWQARYLRTSWKAHIIKGRRNLMNGLGEVGCVYVCMYVCMYACSARVELLWFHSGFRVVSDPFGGSSWPWWKEQFTDRKDLNTTYKEMLGKQKEHGKNGNISHTLHTFALFEKIWSGRHNIFGPVGRHKNEKFL